MDDFSSAATRKQRAHDESSASSAERGPVAEQPRPRESLVTGFYIPPPLPLLPQKLSTGDPLLSTGLNMYFKKLDPFS